MPLSPAHWADHLGGLGKWRRSLWALVFGAVSALAMPPFGLPILLIPAFTAMIWMIGRVGVRGAAFAGWWFGVGHFAVGLYWVANAFFVDAAVYGWLAPFAVIGLAAGLAIYPAAAFAAARSISRRLDLEIWAQALTIAVMWTVAEWLRGQLFTGFPWNLVGTVWVVSDAMMQSAAWVGVYGLSLLTVAAASLPAAFTAGTGWRPAGLALSGIVLFCLLWAGGTSRLADADVGAVADVRLRLVQPNIPQHLKWKSDLRIGHVRRQLEMSRQPTDMEKAPTHVIWAETAVPFNLSSDRPLQQVLGGAAPAGGALITGAPRAEGKPGAGQKLWNSIHALSPQGDIVATYDKQHLVPFGEYVPFRSILKFSKLTAGRLDFSPGESSRLMELPGLPAAAALICYEIIFSDEILGARGRSDERPSWLLNLTNDAWFGESAGPHQHLAATRMRAVEQGLPVVRVANTGISAVIDPHGRVLASLPLGQAGVLDSELPQALPDTAYARYGESTNWSLALVFMTLAIAIGRRRGRPEAA